MGDCCEPDWPYEFTIHMVGTASVSAVSFTAVEFAVGFTVNAVLESPGPTGWI